MHFTIDIVIRKCIKVNAFQDFSVILITMSELIEYQQRQSAFRRRLQSFAVVNLEHIDVRTFLEDAFHYFSLEINRILIEKPMLKVSACLKLVFQKVNITPEGIEATENQTIYLQTRTHPIDQTTNLKEFYDRSLVAYMLERIDDVVIRGSGFTLSKIDELCVQINQYAPIAGSTFIELPKYLKLKKAIINVQNTDNQCFKYAVFSALYPPATLKPQLPSSYDAHLDKLNFNGIQFPVELKQISQFEEQNPEISINVYIFDQHEVKVRTVRLTNKIRPKHIHLLLLYKDENRHYCWIKSLSRLLSSQSSANTRKKFYCDRCLNYFVEEAKLEEHKLECFERNDCVIEMPSKDESIMKFQNFKNQLNVPFIIYADIETLLKEPTDSFGQSGSTVAYQQHEPYSIGFYFKCSYDSKFSYYKSKRGPDCIEWFVDELDQISERVEEIFLNPIPLNMSMEDEVLFAMTQECEICGAPYTDRDVPVRDHCHLTGRYRGSAHSDCNLLYKESRNIPVVFHNLTNYDAHFLIKKLASELSGEISIIPINDQRYISFTKTIPSFRIKNYAERIRLRFIDSFRFMASSLDQLASLLPFEKKKILRKEHSRYGLSEDQIKMLSRKGILCYEFIDSWDKLKQTTIPLKDQFHSSLTNSVISDENYAFVQQVWNEFNIQDLGEYTDLYLKTDVLLLADVFENFRANCYVIYKLDPAHYYTSPGLSFDAMLKYTKINIELVTDIDMFLLFEKGIRGGVSQCSKRYSRANNKYMEDFDKDNESKYLMYLDANNLYGYSMMQQLPLNGFSWAAAETFDVAKIMNLSQESQIGYVFEVDLEYPQQLHDSHSDYPFCPENGIVPGTRKDRKLLLTLFDKTKYVIHYRMLQFALHSGLILKKIHRVVQFNQSAWLKPYIDLNTDLRSKATNDFEKNFYKLLCNAIYGKTMENLRARVDIKLKTKWDGRYAASKLISKPNFKRCVIFDEDLVAIEMSRTFITMNRPIAVGMSILDGSKLLMYDFHYNHMKRKYADNIQLMYTGKSQKLTKKFV